MLEKLAEGRAVFERKRHRKEQKRGERRSYDEGATKFRTKRMESPSSEKKPQGKKEGRKQQATLQSYSRCPRFR
ncbi:unnamed protein product [Caenorhabditis auriculariae]|uniref:Uncharacterized protein n=1 Tax=Caenorhabditis auriculariae TaxID=2777116 RepID=A0A8S1H5P4_9PELO|nr:unnamed protein product [Caenorhabditis auriculariae]